MSDEKLRNLTNVFRELGARNPESWARSQLEHGIPQLARFLFLRQAWSLIEADQDVKWIPTYIMRAKADPNAPYSGVGQALERLIACGVDLEDLTELVRGMQAELLFEFCYLLEDPGDVPKSVSDVAWSLVQVTEDGDILGSIPGIYESVLETDPTGREMRPRGPVA